MSSESRFSIMRPSRNPGCISKAPVRPVSSSMVHSTSNGPWTTSVDSTIARAVATPMPLSAPNVVPWAYRRSPRRSGLMGSVEKSWVTSAFFSQTMSRWPWSTTAGALSRPAVPPFRTKTLPAASRLCSRPRLSATPTT